MRYAIIAVLVLGVGPAAAGQWDSAPHHQWYEAQQDCHGGSCCGAADGKAYYGDYTLNKDGSATLGKTQHVDACRVLRKPNPTGHAVVWTVGPTIFCFAPGGGF